MTSSAVTDPEPWWITNYRGSSPLQRYSHHSPAKTRRTVDFYVHQLGLGPGQTILDLCCALGRHTSELTQRGFARTIGVDLSPDILEHATSRAAAGGTRPCFVRADVRALPLADASADAALLLRSFGIFDTSGEDIAVLEEIARVLRPGARLGLDHFAPNSATTAVGTRMLKGPAATTTVHTIWDSATGRLTSEMSTRYEDGRVDSLHSSSRLYAPEELGMMLADAGFVVEGRFGGYDGSRLAEGSKRCVVVARRM